MGHHQAGRADQGGPVTTTDGRPIKIASIVDEHTRECLGGLVERNITGDDLIDELDRRNQRYGLATLCVGGGMGIATVVERIG